MTSPINNNKPQEQQQQQQQQQQQLTREQRLASSPDWQMLGAPIQRLLLKVTKDDDIESQIKQLTKVSVRLKAKVFDLLASGEDADVVFAMLLEEQRKRNNNSNVDLLQQQESKSPNKKQQQQGFAEKKLFFHQFGLRNASSASNNKQQQGSKKKHQHQQQPQGPSPAADPVQVFRDIEKKNMERMETLHKEQEEREAKRKSNIVKRRRAQDEARNRRAEEKARLEEELEASHLNQQQQEEQGSSAQQQHDSNPSNNTAISEKDIRFLKSAFNNALKNTLVEQPQQEQDSSSISGVEVWWKSEKHRKNFELHQQQVNSSFKSNNNNNIEPTWNKVFEGGNLVAPPTDLEARKSFYRGAANFWKADKYKKNWQATKDIEWWKEEQYVRNFHNFVVNSKSNNKSSLLADASSLQKQDAIKSLFDDKESAAALPWLKRVGEVSENNNDKNSSITEQDFANRLQWLIANAPIGVSKEWLLATNPSSSSSNDNNKKKKSSSSSSSSWCTPHEKVERDLFFKSQGSEWWKGDRFILNNNSNNQNTSSPNSFVKNLVLKFPGIAGEDRDFWKEDRFRKDFECGGDKWRAVSELNAVKSNGDVHCTEHEAQLRKEWFRNNWWKSDELAQDYFAGGSKWRQVSKEDSNNKISEAEARERADWFESSVDREWWKAPEIVEDYVERQLRGEKSKKWKAASRTVIDNNHNDSDSQSFLEETDPQELAKRAAWLEKNWWKAERFINEHQQQQQNKDDNDDEINHPLFEEARAHFSNNDIQTTPSFSLRKEWYSRQLTPQQVELRREWYNKAANAAKAAKISAQTTEDDDLVTLLKKINLGDEPTEEQVEDILDYVRLSRHRLRQQQQNEQDDEQEDDEIIKTISAEEFMEAVIETNFYVPLFSSSDDDGNNDAQLEEMLKLFEEEELGEMQLAEEIRIEEENAIRLMEAEEQQQQQLQKENNKESSVARESKEEFITVNHHQDPFNNNNINKKNDDDMTEQEMEEYFAQEMKMLNEGSGCPSCGEEHCMHLHEEEENENEDQYYVDADEYENADEQEEAWAAYYANQEGEGEENAGAVDADGGDEEWYSYEEGEEDEEGEQQDDAEVVMDEEEFEEYYVDDEHYLDDVQHEDDDDNNNNNNNSSNNQQEIAEDDDDIVDPEQQEIELMMQSDTTSSLPVAFKLPLPQVNNPQYLKSYFTVLKYVPNNTGLFASAPKKRIWVVDHFARTFYNLDNSGKIKKEHAANKLIQLERNLMDPTRLRMMFFDANHSYELQFFSALERERFFEAAQAIRPSIRVYAPELTNKDSSVEACTTTIDGVGPNTVAVVAPNATGKPVKRELTGECKINASKLLTEPVTVWTGTFNLSGKLPPARISDLQSWIPLDKKYDLYAVACQEASFQKQEGEWFEYLGRFFGSEYIPVASMTLWDTNLIVFTKKKNLLKITCVEGSTKATQHKLRYGTKGGIGISLRFLETSFAFVTCHLAARVESTAMRNTMIEEIIKGLQLGVQETDFTSQFNHVFFFGDFNYRVELDADQALKKIEAGDFADMLSYDQLTQQMSSSSSSQTGAAGILSGFEEAAPITFPPTYRMVVQQQHGNKNEYNIEKGNAPSYTDRVLTRSMENAPIKCISYKSAQDINTASEHRPVSAAFVTRCVRPALSIFMDEKEHHLPLFTFKDIQVRETSRNHTPFPLLQKPQLCVLSSFTPRINAIDNEGAMTSFPRFKGCQLLGVSRCHEQIETSHFTFVLRDAVEKRADKAHRGSAVLCLGGRVCDMEGEVQEFEQDLTCNGSVVATICGKMVWNRSSVS